MDYLNKAKKYYPYLLAALIVIRMIASWPSPETVHSEEFASSEVPRWVRFWLQEIQPVDQDPGPVRVVTIISDDEATWVTAWGSEDQILSPTSSGSIELGKFSGSVDSNTSGETIEIYVAVLEYRKQYKDITQDIVSLLQDTLLPRAISSTTGQIWDFIISQGINQASSELGDYLSSANLIDDFRLTLRRQDQWGIGLPVQSITNGGIYRIKYQISGADEVLVALPPIVQTATPVFNAPTATPMPDFAQSISIVDSNTAINLKDQMDLIRIPAGEFTMGITREQGDHLFSTCDRCSTNIFRFSEPVHEVYVDAYWFYKTEVTVEQYKICLNQGFCRVPHSLGSATIRDYFNNRLDQEAPVINVDWDMANEYCNWAGGRLPTEAEWEKAGRGTDGRLFPWGDQFPNSQLANYDGARNYDVTYVGKYPDGASPYGVLDMAGNVYEWVSDWYHDSYYQFSPYENPQGPNNFENQYFAKVVRGGNFSFEAAISSVALHDWYEPEKYGNGVGFRCAMGIE